MINYEIIRNVAVVFAVFGGGIFLILIGVLSVQLRKEKWKIIKAIEDSAPKMFRKRAKLIMENGASWVVGSSISYVWFGYFMMRILWRIPRVEVKKWQAEIKNILGKNFYTYILFVFFFNISTFGGIGVFFYKYILL